MVTIPKHADFFDRLVKEESELKEKLGKLHSFVNNDELFGKLSEDHQKALLTQKGNMEQYSYSLGVRIDLFKSEGYEVRPPQPGREMTYGEKAVGLSFNPGGSQQVERAKLAYANVIDNLNDLRKNSNSTEQKRLASIAITEAQCAQMWAVKAITWKD